MVLYPLCDNRYFNLDFLHFMRSKVCAFTIQTDCIRWFQDKDVTRGILMSDNVPSLLLLTGRLLVDNIKKSSASSESQSIFYVLYFI